MRAEIFSLWLALWLHCSKITHAVPVKPPVYLKGTISAGVSNKDSLNLKWRDRPYFIVHGMTTQLGWRRLESYEDIVGIQQHKQTITSVVMRSQVSGESFPLTESHLLLCFLFLHSL